MTLIWDALDVNNWGPAEIGVNATQSNVRQQAASFNRGGGVIVTPPNGCSLLQWIRIIGSDGQYTGTGYRNMSRKAEPIPMMTPGYESWWVYATLQPSGYPNGASVNVSPWEIHQTNPGGGTGVATAHRYFVSAGEVVDQYGGSKSAGGIGNPGRVTTFAHLFDTGGGSGFVAYPNVTQRLVWKVCVVYLKHGIPNVSAAQQGAYRSWAGVAGTDAAVYPLTNLITNAYTMFANSVSDYCSNYLLFGLYENQPVDFDIYTAGLREYSNGNGNGEAEALAWASVLLGGAAPPPPPPETPPAGLLGGKWQINNTALQGDFPDHQRAYRAVVETTGTCTALETYREPSSAVGTGLTKLAVWPSNAAGTAPALGSPPLGTTAELAFTTNTPAGRYSAAVTPFAVTAGQVVWIGDIMGGQQNIAMTRKRTVVGAFRLMVAPYSGGPIPWDATMQTFDFDLDTYLIGTPGGGGGSAIAPSNTVAPVIIGSSQAGQVLTVQSVGTWLGNPAPSFAYQWRKIVAGVHSNITGATGSSYQLTAAEVGIDGVYVRITGSNASGSATADSNTKTGITAAPTAHRYVDFSLSDRSTNIARTVGAGRVAGAGGGGG